MTNHTTSQKLSQRLKKAGVKQESEFYWLFLGGEKHIPAIETKKYSANWNDVFKASAFLASELLEMLPQRIEDYKPLAVRKWENNDDPRKWWVYYESEEYRKYIEYFNKSLPEAAGAMLLWVKENGYD